MSKLIYIKSFIVLTFSFYAISTCFAANSITRMGAERSANANGSIPEWKGGMAQREKTGTHHDNPYEKEKPLFIITAKNWKKHKKHLTEGHIALLKRYPDTFKIPVYPTHRSASFPEWVLKNTEKNKGSASLTEDGMGIKDALGGIPFPNPDNGLEAIWNHLVRWRGMLLKRITFEAVVFKSGTINSLRAKQEISFNFYRPRLDPNDYDNILFYYTSFILEPARLAGGALLMVDTLNQRKKPRQVWGYDAGSHRVRRIPNVSYDSPALLAESLRTTDDTDIFNGATDRFTWQLMGKKEIYIAYNSYQLTSPSVSYESLLTPNHMNPDFTRYELHRVWVVEAKLKEGSRHIYSRRTYYLDEDSWNIATVDQYNQAGNIWRVSIAYLKSFYEIPAVLTTADAFHDLRSGNYHVQGLTNEEPHSEIFSDELPPKEYFTPSALRQRVHR